VNAPLEELVKTLGLPAALRLVERFGGTRIYLPRSELMSAEHAVAQVVGLEAARDLCKLWPSERPSIPRAAQFLRGERDRALLTDANDHTVPQLALKYELTERQVYYILARGLPELDASLSTGQKTLF
jgi:Mor family transcriptional regulator